jgi:hypothetical protein
MMMKSSHSVASLLVLVVTATFIVPAAAREAYGAARDVYTAAMAREAYAGAARDAYTAASAVGREVPAPPWSAACMTDHGPSACGEPMWVYGSPARAHDK